MHYDSEIFSWDQDALEEFPGSLWCLFQPWIRSFGVVEKVRRVHVLSVCYLIMQPGQTG